MLQHNPEIWNAYEWFDDTKEISTICFTWKDYDPYRGHHCRDHALSAFLLDQIDPLPLLG